MRLIKLYLFIFFLLFLLSLSDFFYYDKKVKNILYNICVILLILISGFRYKSGLDYDNYLNLFKNADSLFKFSEFSFEPGFYFLSWINNIIFKIPYTLFFFISAVSVYLKTNLIKKYSPYIFISLTHYYAFFYHNQEMGQIRNGLAISILLFSIKYIEKENFKKFLLAVVLATSIHYTSIIFIFAYFVNKIKLKRKTLILLLITSILVGFINLNGLFINFFKSLPELDVFTKGLKYLQNGNYTGRRGVSGTEIWRFLILFFNILFYNNLSLYNRKKYRLIAKLYFLGVFIFFALNSNALFSRRFSRPFLFLEGIIISYNIYTIKHMYSKIGFLYLVSIAQFYNLYVFLNSGNVSKWETYKHILKW